MKTKLLLTAIIGILLFGCQKESVDPVEIFLSNRTFQLSNVDHIAFTNDRGMLLSGYADDKYTLIKTDAALNVEWSRNNYDWGKRIFGSGWGSPFYAFELVKAFQLSDGKYVCIGSIHEGGDVIFSSALVVVLNSNGDQLQQFRFDNLAVSNALQTTDGYLLFGNKLVKLDKNFSKQWSRDLYDTQYFPTQVVATSDGGYAVTGSYKGEQLFLKKLDAAGRELWSRTYKHNEFPFEEAGYDLIQLDDKGYLVAGRTGRTMVPNVVDCQIVRTDAAGDTLWTKRFGYATNNWLEHIVSSSQSNEFILQGTIGFPNEDQKSLLIKITAEGQIVDSTTVDKFQIIARTPLNVYLKARRIDETHTGLLMMEAGNLFGKK